MTNNSGSAPGFDTAGLEFDSHRVPFLYSPNHLSFALRHSPNHLGVSFILRHHAKKSGARHFSSSHWQARGKPKAIVRYRSHNHQRRVRYDLHGAAGATTTTRTPQQHSLHQRSANLSLPEKVTSEPKNVSYPLCLVLLKRVSIFDCIPGGLPRSR